MTTNSDASAIGADDWLHRALDEHRRELHAHCYRLTGNVADGEDLLQETFLRAWRSRETFEGRSSVRAWLYRIATNRFLDSRKAAAHRTMPSGDPFEWGTALGPYPDLPLTEDAQSIDVAGEETVELALIGALTYLPPRQRAAFVLRDVHGYLPPEIAAVLDATVPTVNSLIQRARVTMRLHAPADPAQWRRPKLTRADKEILRLYAAARRPEEFRALLADDVRITMPPEAPVRGIEAASEFLGRPLDWHTVHGAANGRPALINYIRWPGNAHYDALVVDVLRILDGKIAEINAFVGAQHVTAFGLPLTVWPPGRDGEGLWTTTAAPPRIPLNE